MKKIVRLGVLLFCCLGVRMDAEEIKEYLIHAKEITDRFARDMKKKHNLYCYGSEGSMPCDVAGVEMFFTCYSKVTIEEARRLEVLATEELLFRINGHEKIRPFLREYPFQVDRARVTISFESRPGQYRLDGSVAQVSTARGKIYYDAAEIQTGEPFYEEYLNDKNEIVKKLVEFEPEEELVLLMEEPYEKALKIVKGESP